jgi:type I restriction enzyme S subunit
MTARASGASYPAVTEAVVRDSRLPLPPVAEQRRITAVLDKANAIRRKRRESLGLLDEFLPAVYFEIFGDPVRNEKGWKILRLGELLTFVTSGSRGWAKYYADTGFPFLRIQNVGQNGLKLDDLAHVNPPAGAEADRTRVRAGDVLLSITADLGRTAVVSEAVAGGHINQHLAILRVRDVEPLYLGQFLASAGGRRQFEHLNRQAVKAGLNFDDIRSLNILLPPRELQDRFTALFLAREETTAGLRRAVDEADRLFDSLTHRAFRGEL